jgi:MFS family permease
MSTSTAKTRIPGFRVGVLGVITITVYGSWYYSFGVLLDPIIADTGWREGVLATAFGVSSLIAGFGSLAGGWLLDRFGSRVAFGVAALLGAIAFLLAASARSAFVFAVAAAVGGGVFASLGFYHVTQTAAVRISPGAGNRAIAILTIWGAFASAIFIPVAAWLVGQLDWRVVLRLLTMSAVIALLIGALTIDTAGRHKEVKRSPIFRELAHALRAPRARRFLASQGLAGIGVATILVYQVPAMTSAGLALGVASFWAGFRGFAQLGGRLPLMPLVTRLGVANTLRVAYVAIAVGAFALAFAGTPFLAGTYAVVAGFGIGAVSPIVGMHSKTVFGESSLGTAMGLVSLVFLVVGSVGPVLAGWIAEATGSRLLPVTASALLALGAGALIRSSDSSI